jgi:hypothetical protein
MANRRKGPLITAAVALAAVWLACWAGYVIAKHSKMTLAKVMEYERSIDLTSPNCPPRNVSRHCTRWWTR